jgi:DNA-binding phage protein
MRVTRSRELVAECHSPSVVARVAQISREAIYRVPTKADDVEAAIVEVAKDN